MDQSVKDALARWPDVPAVYGWLSLDARGRWRLHPQGQSAQGRNGDGANRGGLSAIPGHEPQADAEPVAAPRASDPRVRFA